MRALFALVIFQLAFSFQAQAHPKGEVPAQLDMSAPDFGPRLFAAFDGSLTLESYESKPDLGRSLIIAQRLNPVGISTYYIYDNGLLVQPKSGLSDLELNYVWNKTSDLVGSQTGGLSLLRKLGLKKRHMLYVPGFLALAVSAGYLAQNSGELPEMTVTSGIWASYVGMSVLPIVKSLLGRDRNLDLNEPSLADWSRIKLGREMERVGSQSGHTYIDLKRRASSDEMFMNVFPTVLADFFATGTSKGQPDCVLLLLSRSLPKGHL